MSILDSRIYYIDSEKRLSGTNSNFSYKITIPDSSKYDRVVVLQLTIPLSYYLIRAPNNNFTLTENTTSVVITVPEGNYTAISFANTVTTILNTSSPNGFKYTITLNNSYTSANTGKYTFTVSNNTSVQPSFTFGTRVCQQMGFDENSTNSFVANTLSSVNVLDFIPSSTLFLHSDMVEDNTSVLQELYSNNTIQYSNHVYKCPNYEQYSKKLRSNKDSVFNFAIEDEHGNEINLNGHSILFTLMLYRKDNFTDIFKEFIKYSIHKTDQLQGTNQISQQIDLNN